MKNETEMYNNLNAVFALIEEAVDDDNIIKEDEFQKIQKLKEELNVTSKFIHDAKKPQIERILYLQLYLLLLDDNLSIKESEELGYYREIFGYTDKEIFQLEIKVRKEKQEWKERKLEGTNNVSNAAQRTRNIPASIKRIVWDRDGGKCVLCGNSEYLEFDHEIPFSRGGSNSTENIRVLCRNCNQKKSDNIGLIRD